jgi:succinylglutamate desuccinylase
MSIDAPIPRILGEHGRPDGPLLVVLASIHGNEPAGYHAARRVSARLATGDVPLVGRVLFLAGNRAALATRTRQVEVDLNRLWAPEVVARLRAGTTCPAAPADEAEARELLGILDAQSRERPRTVLDLHTTSGPSLPFAVLADALPNRRLARALEVPVILGLEEQLDGTLLSVLEADGWITCGCEGGQHDDPVAIDHCEAAIWLAMASARVVRASAARSELAGARALLRTARRGVSRVFEVRYRHGIVPADRFVMAPGWASFRLVAGGELLGSDRHGAVHAPEAGRLLMPLYQPTGSDGFFVMRAVNRAWLVLAWVLRRLGVPRLVPLLPGVRRDPARPGVLVVDRRTARWRALEIMHLLGFRRERLEGDLLVVSRRPAGMRRDG